MSFYNRDELRKIGISAFGENVRISRKASIYNAKSIRIGSNVRIDDYCVLSAGDGGIVIGDYVHVAVFCSLIGAGKITLMDFSNLSSRVAVYSSNDDYSGKYLTNPTVPSDLTYVHHADVVVGRHAIIGSGTVILPGVTLEDGVAVGALSLVKKNCKAFGMYAGVPAKHIGNRERRVLELEKELRDRAESS